MICLRCLHRATRQSRQLRTITTAPPTSSPQLSKSTSPNPPPPQLSAHAITSTSAAQPFSAPHGSKVVPRAPVATRPASSVPAGMVLKGLNYFKNKSDPVALEDHEYPEWLWTLLDERKTSPADGEKEEVDPRLFSKSARARQIANKRARKLAQSNPEAAVKKVPLYEQSVNLPVGEESAAARGELTKSMRGKRRRDIKEGNFLKSMS